MNRLFNTLENERGNSVIAILVTLIAASALLQTTSFSALRANGSQLFRANLKEGRDTVVYQVDRYASLPSTFRNSLSATENSALRACVLGTSPASCRSATEYAVSLYGPAASATTPALRMSGVADQNSVFYDTKGVICSTPTSVATEACPFEVSTTFTAKCPSSTPAGSPCATAEAISVHYVVKNSIAGTYENGGRFAPIDKFASPILISDIMPHPYGYATRQQIAAKTVSAPAPTGPHGQPTYAQAFDAVLAVTSNRSLAETIANYVYTEGNVTDLALVTALTKMWLTNSAAAKGLTQSIWMRYLINSTIGVYTAPISLERVESIAAATSWITDPILAEAIGRGEVTTIETAQQMVTALAGVTNASVINTAAKTGMTDTAMVQAMNSAVNQLGVNDLLIMYFVSNWVKNNNVTDEAAILKYTLETAIPTAYPPVSSVAAAAPAPQPQPTAPDAEPPVTSPVAAATISGELVTTCTSGTACGTKVGL